jgi:tetratricopeptide (TPR) repeat protein
VKKPQKKQIIFSIILVVVIGASATAATLFMQYQASIVPPPGKQETNIAGTQKLPVEEKADTAEQLAFEGDITAGVKTLDDAIKSTTDQHDKFVYYSHKATILLNNQDFPAALAAALQAYEVEKTSASAAFVGQIAQEKGDVAQATEYYKKAIELIDPEDPFADEDKAYYQGIVTELERGVRG